MDRGGNMPQLRTTQWESRSHPYYVRYVSNRPVAYKGPANVITRYNKADSVWCYDRSKYVPITTLKPE